VNDNEEKGLRCKLLIIMITAYHDPALPLFFFFFFSLNQEGVPLTRAKDNLVRSCAVVNIEEEEEEDLFP